jgi:AraC family transcriptional regulator
MHNNPEVAQMAELACVQPLRTLNVPGFSLCEATYDAAGVVPAQPHAWASLCLTIEGGYQVDWGRTALGCGPASLVFHPPGQVYGVRISEAGSQCLTVGIDPAVLRSARDLTPDVEYLAAMRRTPPHWLAFELRRALELADDLSSTAVASTVAALLAELDDRPALEARSTPPPWLNRVQEQIDDEFRGHPTLESLAGAADVHPVHLAREFRRYFRCTVGHYIRQQRVAFACHRLTASRDPLPEIALDAGFADQSHFTNTFRRLVGMTPGAFRARFAPIHRDRRVRR